MSFGFGFGFPKSAQTPGGATLNLQFAGASALDPRITFTRALNTATYFNSAGVLTTANANVPRFDYDPATLAPRGLLIEEARTNSIRNNTMQGTVAGTPGTLPTNWVETNLAAGLTREIVGTGTANGLNYIDIRISGTTADTNGWNINTDANTQIVASSGQVWTGSFYIAVVGGSTTNMSGAFMRVIERSGAGAYVAETAKSWGAATSSLINGRFIATRTMGATTGYTQLGMYFSANSGVAIDITLRIGLPQLEQGAFATSVIPTTTTALTRNADVASVNTLTPWYNATEGTIYAESQILYSTGGTLFPGVLSANNGASTNQIMTYYINTNRQNLYVRTGGTVVVDTGPTASANSVFKFAGAYKENDFAATTNGAAVSTDTAGTLPTAADRLLIGSQALGNAPLNGTISRITYYPRRLSNTELQAITS